MTVVPHHIVVGIDDSPTSRSALTWAIAEARTRKVGLHIVHAHRWDPIVYSGFVVGDAWPGFEPAEVQAAEKALVDDAVAQASAVAPELTITGQLIEGDAVTVLSETDGVEAVLVVGSRHASTLDAAVFGSVSKGVAKRADRPVAVVCGPAGDPAESSVVAAIDGSEHSQDVLAYAFDHASRHSVGLDAILCWHPRLTSLPLWRGVGSESARQRAAAWLAESLAGWREKYPDVSVAEAVVDQNPEVGLVMMSHAANLLVLGAGHRRSLTGGHLGSVTRTVLHDATCPVVVLPPLHS